MITPTASQNEVIKCTYESGTTVKVVAGPGSGKTLTLMLKVRELVSKGIVRADEILILSLTNKAVDNVMHKLWDVFSELDSKQDEESQKATADLISQIGVYTIHGLANRVVVENEGLINIIEENGWRGLLKLIPPNLLKKYTQHRRQGVLTPKLFERLFREYQTRGGNKIEDNVMEQIMKLMKGSKVVTNEELILLAVQYLQPRPVDSTEDPSVDPTTFTQSLLHKHKVVIIDEFQDLFPSLVPLIKAISQNKQLLLFGDPYQSIYEFLGDNKAAMRSLEGMRSSKNLKTFHLYDNFRSTPEITTCANSVIRDDIRSSVPGDGNQFYSKPRMGFPYQMLISTDPIEELEIITDKICQLVSNSVRLSDIAILTRTNAQLKAVSDHLNSYGIPSEKLTSQPDWMSDQNIKFLIDLLKASVLVASDNASDKGNLSFRNRSDFSVILTVSALKGVSNQSIQALYSGAQKMGVSLWEFISQCDDWPAEVTNKTKLKSYVRHMIPMIKHVASNEQIEPISVISQLVETAYNIGYMPNELKTTEEIETFRTHLLNMLSVLKASAYTKPASTSLVEWFLEIWHDQGTSFEYQGGQLPMGGESLGSVKVSTLHSSKGLEFPTVFLMGGSNTNFPIERNTLYVGMTRARNLLFLSNVKHKALCLSPQSNASLFDNAEIWKYYNCDLNRAYRQRSISSYQKYRMLNNIFGLNLSVKSYSTMCSSASRVLKLVTR